MTQRTHKNGYKQGIMNGVYLPGTMEDINGLIYSAHMT